MPLRTVIVGLIVFAAIGAAGCSDGESADVTTPTGRPDQSLLQKCGSRGAPVSLRTLIEVARANGITLDVHRRGCRRPASDPHSPDATNLGPSGVTRDPAGHLLEGAVFCDVAEVPKATNDQVEVIKYPTDQETQVGVLNVGCSVYPFNAESESRQVDRLRRALKAIGDTVNVDS